MRALVYLAYTNFCTIVILNISIVTFAQMSVPGGFALQVNGQVRYADSRAPADNVLVRIEAFEGGGFNQIMTDRTGKFSFAGLRPISYIVTVHMPGYVDYSERVDLQVNPSPYINAMLMADKNSIQNRATQLISLAPSVID